MKVNPRIVNILHRLAGRQPERYVQSVVRLLPRQLEAVIEGGYWSVTLARDRKATTA